MIPGDPRSFLDQLGIVWHQEIGPDDGYSDRFWPECLFNHWTAGSGTDGNSAWAVRELHYGACVPRSGVVQLGAWNSRVGHGGWGRSEPIGHARRGIMTPDLADQWAGFRHGDDTNSWPNSYAMSVCLDYHPDQNDPIPGKQWNAYCATTAAFLHARGLHLGHLMDHSVSTNRKWDLDPLRRLTYTDVHRYLVILGQEPTPPGGGGMSEESQTIVSFKRHPSGRGGAALFADGRLITRYLGHRGDPVLATTHSLPEGTTAVDFDWDMDSAKQEGYTILASNGATFDYGGANHLGTFSR